MSFKKPSILDSGDRHEFATGAVRDMQEIWLPVVGYEGLYEVSNIGRVRSLRSKTRIADKENKIMRQKLDKNGYFRVNLNKEGKMKAMLVNRIVAEAFIPNPNNLPIAGHDNDVKTDNYVGNLYWTNASENLMHNGLQARINAKRQLKIDKIAEALAKPIIGTSLKTGEKIYFKSAQEASRNGFGGPKISLCCNGKKKSHKGFSWQFVGVGGNA